MKGRRFNQRTGEMEEAQPMSSSAGGLGLPTVTDPDRTFAGITRQDYCLLYTSPSPRDRG